MTREEAINKLEYLINSPVGREEIDETCYEVMKYIAAQGPRVMTWNEVKAWHKIDEIYRDPIFVEYRYEKAFGPSRWYISRYGIGAMSDDEKQTYNKYIRCWTSRPDQAARDATPWKN